MNPKHPSLLFVSSVVVALLTLFFSTGSALVVLLLPLYLSALLIHGRLPRDSSLIWGGRLFVYAGFAVIGRAPIQSFYYMGAQAFVTMGLILGGELALQSFREPPEGFKFDPMQLLVSSLLFLVGCNPGVQIAVPVHLWICAPLWLFLTILAAGDVREGRVQLGALGRVKQIGLLSIAVCAGFLAHSGLANNRTAFMALGARLLADARPNVSEVGVADAPTLASSFNTNASTARLLRITGSLSDSHLRAGAFDDYQNGAWGPSLSSRAILDASAAQTRENKSETMTPAQIKRNPKMASDQRTDWDAKITVLRDTNKIVFAPLNSSALIPIPIEGADSFSWNRFAGPLVTDNPPPLSYGIIESHSDILGVQTEQGPLCVSLDPVAPEVKKPLDPQAPDYSQKMAAFNSELKDLPRTRAQRRKDRENLLVVPPEVDEGVKQLAQRIIKNANATTQLEKINAVSDYLLKNYTYSLDFVRGPQDPVSDFLLNKKSAHCQYFASAAVMLLRCVGVPARYATGFWAHETAEDGTTTVRGRDAHAWCESYVEGLGWINVEATPPSGRADPLNNPISPTQKLQEQLEDRWAKIRNWFGHLSSFQIAGIMFGALALWGLERWRQAWKRARLLPPKPLPPLELRPLARGFEAALQKRRITLLDGQTWSEAVPPDWTPGREFVEGYNAARFAPRDEEQLRELTVQLRKIQKVK